MKRILLRIAIAIPAVLLLLFGAFAYGVRSGHIGPPPVPTAQVDASVVRSGPAFERAMALPSARAYGAPYSQSNGSYCGPASLLNVQRSTGARVEDEDALLAGSGVCPLGFCFMGLGLDALADVARSQTDLEVTVLRELSLEEFRAHMRAANDPALRYVVNFTRQEVFGAGGGHHSPIGGYLPDEDQVLVLDVNAHYGPWLVPTERLHAAVDTLDGDEKRGLLRLR